ncbi:MAG: G-D-S-L family lipolytic protein [Arthrospira sp. SH-MAG29]|nr:SGNH/GDSL hydrolase family protein [Arthrospira sp. SH-MAG29]MBS0017054.1 G-D-S-L family lipolytic protein [Arthrospira sp. SH-MAG29]
MLIPLKTIPAWAMLSLIGNGILTLVIILLLLRGQSFSDTSQAQAQTSEENQVGAAVETQQTNEVQPNSTNSSFQPQYRLTYEDSVEQLKEKALLAAHNRPDRLTILAGDSLSLWFPPELLPPERTWLNQGISGETSAGLLRRLKVFDLTQPETVFIMIGINDLLRGIDDQTVLANWQEIIRDVKWVHPSAQVVVQSILPHSDQNASWEGRDRLIKIPNRRIRRLNRELEAIAIANGAYFLDLHPLFTDKKGNLRPELSTDGLHLNDRGYLVWSTGLQFFSHKTLGSP